jgi:hypothetical protein
MTDTWQVSAWLDETWFELPLGDGAGLAGVGAEASGTTGLAELEAEVDARVAGHPQPEEQRQRLLDLAQAVAADAARQGAQRAALRWLPHPELDVTSLATLHLFVVDRPDRRPVDEELDRLSADLAQPRPGDRGEPSVARWRTPAGDALRVQVITETDAVADVDESRAALLETVQYWLPVPDQPRTLLLHFATPTLGLADELVAEFDRIAQGLEPAR